MAEGADAVAEERFSALSEPIRTDTVKIVAEILKGREYIPSAVPEIASTISQGVLERARSLAPGFKILVNVSLLQRVGAGLHSTSACFWDRETDGCITVQWETEFIHCVVHVYGVGV